MSTHAGEGVANEHGDRHVEAFCLMLYGCEGCGYRETLWNTRDGVTPFTVGCRKCDGMMTHLPPWANDKRAPDHAPVYGDRVFVDLTPERDRAIKLEVFEKMWVSPVRPTVFEGMTKDAARTSYIETTHEDVYGVAAPEGVPDIRTIGQDIAWLGNIPKDSSVEEIGQLLIPPLCEGSQKQDLEANAEVLEADADSGSCELGEGDRPEAEEHLRTKLDEVLAKREDELLRKFGEQFASSAGEGMAETFGERKVVEVDVYDLGKEAIKGSLERKCELVEGKVHEVEIGDTIGVTDSIEVEGARTCRICECSEEDACDEGGMPCSWA